MLPLLVVAAFSLASPEVLVKPLSGEAISGRLVLLSGDKLAIEVPQRGEQAFVLSELRTITVNPIPAAGAKTAAVQIRLTDGSLLQAQSLTIDNGRAKIALQEPASELSPIELSARMIHWVRFDHRRQPSIDKQWSDILTGQWTGDVLVARRAAVESIETGDTVTERSTLALDPYEGLLRGVTAREAVFEIDDERFTPSLEKLEGFVFRQSAPRSTPPVVCNLVDASGSRWSVQSLQLEDNGDLQFKTVAGIDHRLPLSDVASLDFAGANIVYLSDLEPESDQWSPFIRQPAGDKNLAQLFSYRRDRSIDGGPLQVDQVQYDKGLGIHSRTQLVYRVPEGFQRFRAIVGINDRVRHLGQVKLVISGDQKILYEHSVEARGGKERTPGVELDMDVSGVRRLTILVDFGGGLLDVADHLDLCDARFTK